MNAADDYQAALLTEISAFLRERAIAESTFGMMAVRDAGVVGRVRRGVANLRTTQRLYEFMAAQRRLMAAERS